MASFIPDADGRAFVTVKNEDGSSIVVYEQGAHITSWKNAKGTEMLYLSPNAIKKDRVPIRGGVPIIFPQFGNRGPLTPSHGFARIRQWKLENVDNGRAVFSFFAGIDELSVENNNFNMSDSQKNAVHLTYTVTFSNEKLTLSVDVLNSSEEVAANFHFCFHTYFRVEDVAKTVINGFNRSSYYDQTKKMDGKNESMALQKPSPLYTISNGEEVDRIYPNQACAIVLQQPTSESALHISSTTLPDVVLWNPGEAKCKKEGDASAFKDLPEDGYKHFVCVEHGYITRRVTVPPSSSWHGSQCITVMGSTPVEAKI
ncbi:uncharacterized protein LOC126766909 [Bactrocera neohumeralis]|uniref:uncharacterized protein LOC126766909 n=1 Tax=Bactrocera neohumeralis TaxID=98809 RepID=UPI002165019B|nr:uncharacterized protein LOC126766909 [Bactrocera neohumeralis]